MAQILCLIMSIIFLIPTVYQIFHSKVEAVWIYINMALGWIAGIIFYIMVIFTEIPVSHDVSANLRLFQYMCFGVWVFFVVLEKHFGGAKPVFPKETRASRWLKKLKAR